MLHPPLLWALLSTAHAQSVTHGVMKGTVTDEAGIVIPGVTITISSESLSEEQTLQTDPEGRFVFPDLPPGVYSLTAERKGFITVTKTMMNLNAGRNTLVNIEMKLEKDQTSFFCCFPEPPPEMHEIGRSLWTRPLYRLPGETPHRMESGPSWTGARTVQVERFDVTDPVTGETALAVPALALSQTWDGPLHFATEDAQSLGRKSYLNLKSGGHRLELIEDVQAAVGEPTAGVEVAALAGGEVARDRVWLSVATDFTDERTALSGQTAIRPQLGADWVTLVGVWTETAQGTAALAGATWDWFPSNASWLETRVAAQHTVNASGTTQWRASGHQHGMLHYDGLVGSHQTSLGVGTEALWRTSAAGDQLAVLLPGVYLEDELYGQKWTLHSGVRYDGAVLTGDGQREAIGRLSPRGRIVYHPIWRVSLLASAGRFSRLGRLGATAPWSVDPTPLEEGEVPLQADVAQLGAEGRLGDVTWLRGFVSRRVPVDEGTIAFQDDRADLILERTVSSAFGAFVSTAYTVTTDSTERISVPCGGSGEITDERITGQALAVWDTPTQPWTLRLGAGLTVAQGSCGAAGDIVHSTDRALGLRAQQRIPIRSSGLFLTAEVTDIGSATDGAPTWRVGARFEHD